MIVPLTLNSKPISTLDESRDQKISVTPVDDSMDILIKIANTFDNKVVNESYAVINEWLQTNMNTEIKYNIDSNCQNIVFNNYGTIFYYACATDNCELLKYIVNYANIHNIFIDINYRNKDLNNDSCLLHVVNFGYMDCLDILLTLPAIDYYIKNEHISFTLGQTLKLNDVGSQNILFIALENSKYDCLDMLFTKLQTDTLCKLQTHTNFYGETFVQVLHKKYTTYTSNTKNYVLLNELKKFVESYFPTLTLTLITDFESLCKRQYMQLQTISTPLIHTITHYNSLSVSDKLYKNINAFNTTCNYESFAPQVHKLLVPFPEKLCKSLLLAFRNYRKLAVSSGNPIYIRHDNNMGSLDKCGFGPVISKFIELINKYLKNNKITEVQQTCSACFLIENFIGVDKEFAVHKDNSNFTFNLCLERSDDLIGSELEFYDSIGNHEYTYTHDIGAMVIHPGSKLHKANNIKYGTRSSLIIWTKNIE